MPATAAHMELSSGPRKRARDVVGVLSRDKEAVPLKVHLVAWDTESSMALDPVLPAKKLPVFPEFTAAATEALRTLEPDLPVKKQVAGFLLENPPQILRPPPG